MKNTIINFLVTAFLVFIVSNYILTDGINLSNWYTSALIFAIILAIINSTIWLVLRIIWFPINFLTFWLFSFVITLFIIWLTDYIYSGIDVNGILSYLFIAFLPAITSAIISSIKEEKKS